MAEGALEGDPAAARRGATYAAKLDRSDGIVDWSMTATDLDRRVRALNPWPGTMFTMRGERIKLLAASLCDDSGPGGTVLGPRLPTAARWSPAAKER